MTDGEWELILPILPNLDKGFGRPRRNDRELLNAIIHILWTGEAWRDLPDVYGPWQTAYDRMRCWQKAGAFTDIQRKIKELFSVRNPKEATEVDVYLDSTTVKVHKAATGQQKKITRRSRQ